ncbi:MAG: QueT transporter family protein [Lachnospiraceae bacterium]|nr:QueT transporter family protein [Lachnospiraceae bacterium]
MKTNMSKGLFLAQAALIGAIYIVITIIFAPISFGPMQVRISEALTILPLFTPAAIPGLFIGALLGNLLGGAVLPDIIFGSLATLIAAFGTYGLRHHSKFLAVLPPIVVNAIIIPFVIHYGYGVQIPIPLLMLYVGVGQIIACGILGLLLHKVLEKYKHQIFRNQHKVE